MTKTPIDQNKMAHKSPLTRRRFLRATAVGAAITAAGLSLLGLLRFIVPRTRDTFKINIGLASDYPVNTFTLLRESKLFVYRDHRSVRVLSAECTHLGCVLETSDDGFLCPCHGSAFARNGQVRSGPAPRPLSWFKVELATNNTLIVNRRIRVRPEEKLIIA